jgi:predicted Zn finger-like uncharacterized protein
MLLSTCPNCNARFRVAPEQLNVRQGHVMCGRCRHVFNAFESLKRVEDEPQHEPIDYSIVAGAAPREDASEPTAVDPTPEQYASDVAPTQALYASTPEEHEQFVATTVTVEEPPPIPTAEGQFDADVDRTIPQAPAQSEALTQNSDPPALPHQSVKASDDPVAIPESFRPHTANPLIGGKIPTQRKPSWVWRWLAAGAALALLAQVAYQLTHVYRAWTVEHLPQVASVLTSVCNTVGCVMPLGRDVNAIKVESSDLVEQPGKPGRILLSAIVANRGALKQAFPVLEIVLTDAKETVIASRVLEPAAYLGRVPTQAEGIAPNTELYINLNLDLIGGATASGYAVRVFYP